MVEGEPGDDADGEDLRERGRQAASRGASADENPYARSGDSRAFFAWHKGFVDARRPDPDCPRCQGTDALTPEDEDYAGATLRCWCNDSR